MKQKFLAMIAATVLLYQAWCFRLYNGVYILRTAKSSTGVRVRPALAF